MSESWGQTTLIVYSLAGRKKGLPVLKSGNTSTLADPNVGHAAAGSATAAFNNTSLTPGHAPGGTRGRAAAEAATPTLSNTSNALPSAFMFNAPFPSGQ